MMKEILAGLLLPFISFGAQKPPRADKIPHEMKNHNDVRIDNYYWLRDIKNPKVKPLLEAENRYLKAYFSKKDIQLQKQIVKEIKSKIEEDESSSEIVHGDFAYYSKTLKGKNYRQHLRRHLKTKATEILLDENIKAKNKEFFATRSKHLSPDQNKIAWCFDYDGSGKCEVEILDLTTKKWTQPGIDNVYWGNIAWGPDSQSLFYTLPNAAWRPDSIWLFNGKGEKKKVLSEKNELFSLDVSLSTDDSMVLASSGSFEQSHSFYWTGSEFKLLFPSKDQVLATVDHSPHGFFAHSNHLDKNYGIYHFKKPGTPMSEWETILKPSKTAKLTNMAPIKDSLVYSLLSKGNEEIHLLEYKTKKDTKISFPEDVYEANFFIDGSPLVPFISYDSPLSPGKTFQMDLQTGALNLVKERRSPSLQPDLYKTELQMVKSRDGKQIPIHIVYKKALRQNKPQPVLLYSYGSYGITVPSGFSESLFSLLDRGFIYVNAHIRGSDAQGEDWYDDGKMMNKLNTFNDFVDVSNYLIQKKITTAKLLAIRGGSAGGLLVGAAINQKPENFRAAIAEVPFVDVLTTMLDSTIPLTTQEYLQWGNPNEKEAYQYMKSYSPYDNISKAAYPALFVQTGITDQQVAYWEPTKWVQKIRDFNLSPHPVLLKVNMGAGHGGASGRYKRFEETAEKYVFLIKELGIQP